MVSNRDASLTFITSGNQQVWFVKHFTPTCRETRIQHEMITGNRDVFASVCKLSSKAAHHSVDSSNGLENSCQFGLDGNGTGLCSSSIWCLSGGS